MKNRVFAFCLLVLSMVACSDDVVVDSIPPASFAAFTINVNAPLYFELNTLGYVYLEEGVKGIILYKHPTQNEYLAYERNCSYQPLAACAKVEVDDTALFMIDKCCNSEFALLDGFPRSGPALVPLRQYITQLNGSFLTISPEVK